VSVRTEYLGYWRISAPLTPEEHAADQPILDAILKDLPDGVTVARLEVWVHGRLWEWEKVNVGTF